MFKPGDIVKIGMDEEGYAIGFHYPMFRKSNESFWPGDQLISNSIGLWIKKNDTGGSWFEDHDVVLFNERLYCVSSVFLKKV